jgi:iron complex outermembrane receptor protein
MEATPAPRRSQLRLALPVRASGRCAAFAALALFPLLALTAPALSAGTVRGTVVSDVTGRFAEGAEVAVAGTELHATTARDGSFTLTGVPAGAQRLVVTYPTHDSFEQAVTVGSDGTVEVPTVHITSQVVRLGEFNVTGTLEGMSEAIAIQKASLESKVVAASDQFGPVSEGNVGEYLKFLPGVSIDYNVNDARGVSLRGLSTTFTIVAVDGTPMAGTSSIDDTRRFEFEQIAMNNVNSTELYKTLSPDMPASATGGFVNFVTKSANDNDDQQRITYDTSLSAPSTNISLGKRGGVWGHGKEFTLRPSIELNFARKVTPKLGFNVNYRLSEKYDDSPRQELTWVTAATAPTVMTAPRLQQYNIRQEEKLTHREAFASKVDYAISDNTKLMIGGQWNWYDLNFTQRGPSFVLGTGSVANATGTGFTSGASGASIQNGVLYREKFGTTWHFNGTLSHTFADGGKLSVTPYWSRANGKYRDTAKGFISTVATLAPGASTYTSFTLDNVSKQGTNPSISLVNGATAVPLDYIRSLANYTLSNTTGTSFQSRPWTAVDRKNGARADYELGISRFSVPLTLRTGVEFDKVQRSISRPDLRGNIPATTGAALTALADPNYTKDVALGFGSFQVVDPYLAYSAFSSNLTFLSANDKRWFDEKNTAAYVRLDANLTPNLLVAGGLRWEDHDTSGTAISAASARSKLAHIDLGYRDKYPSVNFRYTPRRNYVLRGGFSRTIGHPDYGDILPVINSESTPGAANGDITVPSPELKPYYSSNFDLGAEHYLANSGVVSVSLFRKNVTNFIISRGMTAAEIGAIATDYGYNPAEFNAGTVRTNGARVAYQGVELSYAQNLTFLPKPFNSLDVQANFSYTKVSAHDADPFRQLDTYYSALRAVSPKTANVVLGYRFGRFNTTVTNNWVSESLYGGFVSTNYVTGVANITNQALDTRLLLKKDEKFTTDIKLEYSFRRAISAYVQVRNVFNSARKEYLQGYLPQYRNVVLPMRYFEFGEPHLTVGLRGTF